MSELIQATSNEVQVFGGLGVSSMREGCVFDATGDLDAVGFWLQSKANKSLNTFASYRKEAYRFLDWLRPHRLTLSQVKLNHVEAYFIWLREPDTQQVRTIKSAKIE